MAEGEALFQIKVVSKLTGLTADTIRAWERRYEAVQPVRSQSGVRMYTSAHVSRLELLRRVVSRGHAIGRVSHLTDEQLRSLLEDEVVKRPGAAEGAAIVQDQYRQLFQWVVGRHRGVIVPGHFRDELEWQALLEQLNTHFACIGAGCGTDEFHCSTPWGLGDRQTDRQKIP